MTSKTMFTRKDVKKATQGQLFQSLCVYFGDPTYEEKVGLGDAARKAKAGKVPFHRIEKAIDQGWKPDREDISEFLD